MAFLENWTGMERITDTIVALVVGFGLAYYVGRPIKEWFTAGQKERLQVERLQRQLPDGWTVRRVETGEKTPD